MQTEEGESAGTDRRKIYIAAYFNLRRSKN
jgi:hypothetical protein